MRLKGNIILSTLFVILISMVGLALLTSTLTHIKLSRARILKITETNKIYQDLVYYLHLFRQKIFNADIQTFDKPETEYFNKIRFPDYKNSKVTIKHSFDYKEIQMQHYKKIRIIDKMEARSIRTGYGLKSHVMIDMFSGNIPLTHFKLFVNKKINIPKDLFLQKNNIINKSYENIIVDDIKTEFKITDFLIDSLQIGGDILSWEKVREKLGLEISDQPIDAGVYMVVEDNTVESIFIQGNVDRIIFSAIEDKQKVSIFIGDTTYELTYEPGKNYFLCWDDQLNLSVIFKERIIVNGNVRSVEQSDHNAFKKNANIFLFVSGTAVIRSSLKTEHTDQDNVTITNLTLAGSPNHPLNPKNPKSEIVVDSKGEVEIHISIINDGTFKNNCSKLKLLGSLFCRELKNKGTIEITHLKSASDGGNYFHTGNFKFIANFFINFIEEVFNE